MRVVVDTSAVIGVLVNEPSKQKIIAATQDAELFAPASLPVEIGNAFSTMFKRGRILLDEAQRAVAIYQTIPIQLVDIDLARALDLAHDLDIYAYDAYMISCAQRYNALLLTLDGGLQEAARRAGLSLLEV